MVKQSLLYKKLSSYFALSTVAITASQNSKGQIVYHDIKPDTAITKADSIYYLDLNGDDTMDFKIELHVRGGNSKLMSDNAVAYGSNHNYVEIYATTNSGAYARPNVLNSYIGSGDVCYATASLGGFLQGNNLKAVFNGKGDRYIGLKLTKANNIYYGWVRVNVNSVFDTIWIKDYAYNAKPDSSIRSGEGESEGIDMVNSTKAILGNCIPNPATEVSNIRYFISYETTVALDLYDIESRKIKTLLNATQAPGNYSISTDVSRFADGVYFYKLTVNGQIYTQKLVVAH